MFIFLFSLVSIEGLIYFIFILLVIAWFVMVRFGMIDFKLNYTFPAGWVGVRWGGVGGFGVAGETGIKANSARLD